ncbi:MAG: Uma2 family endonuclease [Roseburia sp.]|nr:Uma2 family endonuclease [Roseburia sp.]MCM1201627.1 Uma2 family endonuclease [Bacteroides fragilis]
MPLPQEKPYTLKDIYALPDGQRAELIDGQIYDMAPPARIHQHLLMNLSALIHDYIKSQRGDCLVYPAPFAVFLNKDERNYVEPDISVICDKNKLDDKGCNGAPDWIIEIVSASTQQMDYGVKLFKYRTAGVREYWIVNPLKQTVTVYDFEQEKETKQYSFDDNIPVCIYKDLNIRILELLG